MMAEVCCVEGCKSAPKENILYFQFPVKPALIKKWRTSLGIKCKLPSFPHVCSRHFSETDYELVRGKVRLKARVVPSLCPRSKSSSNSAEPEEDASQTNGVNVETQARNSETIKDANKNEENNEDNTKEEDEKRENYEADEKRESNKDVGKRDVNDKEKTKVASKKQSNNKRKTRRTRRKRVNNKRSRSDEESESSNSEEEIRDSLEHLNNIEENGDDKCNIECAPDLLPHVEDSNSETDLPKEKADIEDIIANYHIKQDKELAERLKEAQIKENLLKETSIREQEDNQEPKKAAQVRQTHATRRKERKRARTISDDDDVTEVEFIGNQTSFIEVSVDTVQDPHCPDSPKDDCLMLLENVQVDIDPSSLMLHDYDKNDDLDDDDTKKKEAISLLTSSDDDDVILQEPKIDTVEVSDEDEDDVPLVKLVDTGKSKDLGKILWGSAYEYYCVHCSFKTSKHSEYKRHKEKHSTVILMCEICSYSSPSKTQFERHRKRHKDDKRYKCHLCDYKAKHNMSLIYHLKSHKGVNFKTIGFPSPPHKTDSSAPAPKKTLTCSKCNTFTSSKGSALVRHVRACRKKKVHRCKQCSYKTSRKSDLRRHFRSIHAVLHGELDDDESA